MCSIYIFLFEMKDGNVTSHIRKMNLVKYGFRSDSQETTTTDQFSIMVTFQSHVVQS